MKALCTINIHFIKRERERERKKNLELRNRAMGFHFSKKIII
jgi:hypothetical protein